MEESFRSGIYHSIFGLLKNILPSSGHVSPSFSLLLSLSQVYYCASSRKSKLSLFFWTLEGNSFESMDFEINLGY